MTIEERISHLQTEIPVGVQLVAVSKFHPAEKIMQAYNAGLRCFGESRVQEFVLKFEELPPDIKWHFIGHLQTNKVRPLIGKITLIESVDTEKLLDIINRESLRANTITNILLQLHIAVEETKFGFLPEEIFNFFQAKKFKDYKAIRFRGLMGMASNTEDYERVRADFHKIHSIYEEIKKEWGSFLPEFNYLSMGMSGDWPIAVEEGANIIRIGSAIFGPRDY